MTARTISIVVDNNSWILPYAETLVTRLCKIGDQATLYRSYQDLPVIGGEIAFFLGCTGLAHTDILQRHDRNLVVHASDLPKGRGFAPSSWQILEGKNRIPVCLLEAVDGPADSGVVIYRDEITLAGHELHSEWRAALGEKTVTLCLRFLQEQTLPKGVPQTGEASIYRRRRPADSRLDPDKTIREQFNLLRIVDNTAYPAFFELAGHTYHVKIERTTS